MSRIFRIRQDGREGEREDYRRKENIGEFVYNGNKYPESTLEMYF